MKILITGSSGLIGTSLRHLLEKESLEYVELDCRSVKKDSKGNILDLENLSVKVAGCIGIVHLAAVSRVVLAQQSPDFCWRTNVGGTRNILAAALDSPRRPWVIYASSREVYGQQTTFPVKENVGLSPLNTYGLSKVCGEMEVLHARSLGLRTAIVRFSNVYGGENDHPDRVIPAFVSGALSNAPLQLEGPKNIFDFTHVDDVAKGLIKLIRLVDSQRVSNLSPLHFVSGQGTDLETLANLVREYSKSLSVAHIIPSRTFDVNAFIGDPDNAKHVLGWSTEISLQEGLSRMIHPHQKVA